MYLINLIVIITRFVALIISICTKEPKFILYGVMIFIVGLFLADPIGISEAIRKVALIKVW